MRCGSQIRSGVFGIGRKSPYFSHELTLAADHLCNWHCKHEHMKLEYPIYILVNGFH
jgi:hypothetical protein